MIITTDGSPRKATKIIINKLDWLGTNDTTIQKDDNIDIQQIKNNNPIKRKILGLFNAKPNELLTEDYFFKKLSMYKEDAIREMLILLLQNGEIREPYPERGYKKL